METEEKENSNPSNNDSKLTLTEMDSQQQHELPNTEPQCDPESASELHHSQLGSVNSESHHQQKQSPQSPQKPSQTESAVVDKSEASQDFIVQESQSDFTSPSLQPPVAERVDGNAMEVKEESLDIERPSQEPLQQEAVEKEVEAGKLVAGAESHRINEDSNLDKDEDVNVDEHAHAHAGNNEIERETVGVAGVPVELETETISEEGDIVEKAEVSDARAESVMADIVEKTEVVAVEEGKEEDVADVEEKVETDDAVEGDETVGNVEKEKVVDTDDVVESDETVGYVSAEQMAKTEVDALAGEQTEVTGTEEDEKVERKDVADISEEMESAEQTGITDIVDEKKAEEDVTDMAEEKEAMEHIEMTSVAEEKKALDDIEEMEAAGETEEAVNVGGEKEETEMVDVAEERDTEEDMDLADGTEAMETAEEEDKVNEAEEAEMADETEEADEEVGISVGGKRKRGKATKAPRPLSKKKMEEDVCFICFDGGELVLCDRRGCPKAYHPSCVNRDEAFFRAKGRWNCGWHLCSNCEKNAHYMCYTCTFSLCKGCTKDAVILCVRGNKGFCETCMKTVMLIERNEQGNRDMGQVDFDDKSSWEYLFKDYWTDLKQRLSLTLEELVQAKNPRKGSDLHSGKQESPDELYDVHNDGRSDSDSSETAEATTSKRKKPKKRLKSRAKQRGSPGTASASRAGGESADESGWASKELLEFVMHMKNGDKSVCSQFDVQALLLEYIKRNKLRDPRRKSQIICDSRLENLFGKPRVGHFEMLKLLESHFILKDDSQVEDLQGSVVDTESNQLEADENSDALLSASTDKRRKSRKKGDRRGLQSNVDDYAAIDMHNINLIFLRRSLLEDLIENTETFHDKVVGSFVRIRISGSAQKQDLYRLVQVVGTTKAAELYRVGKKMTSFMLEILNLNKTEVVSIDIISNQEFTEDECKRLRQSIKCGLINRLTVGDIQEKAMALQAARVQDSLETEITRLGHLRDRASDMGRRKELRECVEKLQLLKSPEERQRRLEEIPEIHADPNMDPSHESDEDEGETEDKRQESSLRPRGSSFSRRGREPISPRSGGFTSNDTWGGSRNYSGMNRELSRNMSDKGFSSKGDDVIGAGEMVNQNSLGQGRDKKTQQSQSWEKPKTTSSASQSISSMVTSESVARGAPEISSASLSTRIAQPSAKVNETEKIWHYQDPSGKIQGPFSMVQLRKWSNTGYFPGNLMIWRTTETKGDSILLTNALAGNFQIDPPAVDNSFMRTQLVQSPHLSSSSSGNAGTATPAPVEVPKYSTDTWGSETNLPSPTPGQSSTSGTKGHVHETQWSPTPAQPVGSVLGANLPSGSHIELQHPTVVISGSSQVSHTLTPSSLSTKPSGQLDGSNMSHNVSPVPQMHSQSILFAESPRVPVNSHMLPLPDSSAPSVNTAVDMRSLQNLVQPVTSSNSSIVGTHGSISRPEMNPSHAVHGTGSQAWGSTPSQKLETNNLVSLSSQPNSGYGNWGNAPTSVKHSTLSLTTGTPSGVSPVPGTGTNPWRALVPAQPVIQPSAPSSGPWGMGMADNQNAIPRQGPENQNTAWGPIAGNQNMGWGSLSTNSNQGWVAAGQVPAPVNANLGWAPAVHGQAPGNANPGWGPPQAPGNAFSGFGPSGQGSAPANANNWVPPGNANTNRATASGNTGTWGSDMNQNGDRFSSHKDRGSHGGDSGFSGGKPWNRQSSFNRSGDSSRLPFKGQRVCKFHENGHCKKGASCDYMHS